MSGDWYITFLLMIHDEKKGFFFLLAQSENQEIFGGDIWVNRYLKIFGIIVLETCPVSW